MHALIPDEFVIRSTENDATVARYELPEIFGKRGRAEMAKLSLADLFYSFGTTHPGAVRLHNFPNSLRDLHKDDGTHLDLAAIDILRDRERGVPRYNQFRRLLRKHPVTLFRGTDRRRCCARPGTARGLRQRSGEGRSMVGLYAEPLPEGFGFSETAFRIFVLMASRRLKSDRFFTNGLHGREMYTAEGMQWIRAIRHVLCDQAVTCHKWRRPSKAWRTPSLPGTPRPRPGQGRRFELVTA